MDGNASRKVRISVSGESAPISVNLDDNETIIDIIKHQGLPVDGVLVMSGGVPVPLDSRIRDLDEPSLSVIRVASGG